ncbi:hypothetical protein FZC33_00095 [Labrys sp. KNU-23]|uniref:sunset domain-containing protein n=1 Tax=Labrys sp. KNU-23 TaxID=2789216 RepID=UPI0011EBBC49|nr:hypothetical protein [Labrys sp. KNU-23]QEN84734.1 hypothetical protein FZC33_00095 [Labrys sp. KNU-23]
MNMNPLRNWRRRIRLKVPLMIAAIGATAVGTMGGAMLPPDTAGVAAYVPVTSSPAPSCNIKGNISVSGERIYHVPGQKYYTKTVITSRTGERWFCSEADARAAGWRRSKR